MYGVGVRRMNTESPRIAFSLIEVNKIFNCFWRRPFWMLNREQCCYNCVNMQKAAEVYKSVLKVNPKVGLVPPCSNWAIKLRIYVVWGSSRGIKLRIYVLWASSLATKPQIYVLWGSSWAIKLKFM